MTKSAQIAIVILNWNGQKLFDDFLPSVIQHSTSGNIEIIVADNGSTDNSIKHLKQFYPSVKIIDLKTNPDTIAKNVVEKGGIVFFSHTEEHRNWGNPYYQGMEIYNFHTDTKDENLAPNIFNFIVYFFGIFKKILCGSS